MIEGMKERFASIRKEHGLNVKEFAESLGMEPTTLSSIESGRREPSKEALLSLAIKYAYSLNWIFTGVGEKRLTKAISPDQNKPSLLENLEKLVDERTGKYGYAISKLEARVAGIEEHLAKNNTSDSNHDVEYPTEIGDTCGFVGESEPEYGGLPYCNDIAAGPPARQHSSEWERIASVPKRLIKTKPEDYYVMRVRGNSMIDALIPDGSMIMLRWSDVPCHGAIQAVWIDERVTLKRMIEDEEHGWTLRHEDGSGRTVPLGEDNRVVGDFVAVLPPNTKPHMRVE